MDALGVPRFEGMAVAVRKRRTQTSRRPRPDGQPHSDSRDRSPLSSTPLSDDVSKLSSDDNNDDTNFSGKMFNLNQCVSRGTSSTGTEAEYPYKKIKKMDGESSALHSNGGPGDGTSHSRLSGPNGDGLGNENKLKKVKLKVGGVTRTIQTNSSSNGASASASSARIPRSSDALRDSDEDHIPPPDKKSNLQGIPWKDFSKGGFSLGKEDTRRMPPGKNALEKQGDKSDPVRKSKRVPKKRVLDAEFDDDEDDEIRYLEKLKSSKMGGYKDLGEESNSKKQRSLARVSKGGKYENVEDVGGLGKDGKKSRSDRGSEDTDYEEDEDLLSDAEPEAIKKKKQKKDLSDLPSENKKEMTLTTRQRALLSSKDASSASQIEFPNGLPPPAPRRQKEKLSEVEQQLKKVEAAQRRRLQNEKAARESEAEAIRKILGQDSSRKKREEKIKKRQEELAQEKAAHAQMLASNTVRWVMGPQGTVVTFPQEMGLPKILDQKPRSYPPPREQCAGPTCTNPYKYRDSKSKLPLCSLQCYKAIHEKRQSEPGC